MFHQIIVKQTGAAWPPLDNAGVHLVGLFQNEFDSSTTSSVSIHSRAMFKTAILLAQQSNLTIDGKPIGWVTAPTAGNMIDALRSTCLAVSASNVVGIVGPELSREAHTIAAFCQNIGIPVVSYAATDADLSDRHSHPAFYRTVPSDRSAALAIVKLFQRFNWTSCIIIHQNDAFGAGGAKTIDEVFTEHDLMIRQMVSFDIATRTVRGNLKTYLTNSATRIVLVWAEPMYMSLILDRARRDDLLGPHFLWILSSHVPLQNLTEKYSRQFIGMLTVEPVSAQMLNAPINHSLLKSAYEIWQRYEPESFPGPGDVDQYALFAFDATWLLIQSLQHFCSSTSTGPDYSAPCILFAESSFCFDRQLFNSTSFLERVSDTAFFGVSGPVGYRRNGTDRIDGIHYVVQNCQATSTGLHFVPVLTYTMTDGWQAYENTNDIIWPGRSYDVPSGRAVLAGVVLRIGVMESPPFTKVDYVNDSSGNNEPKLSGYIPDLIERLRQKMNFNPKIILAPSNSTYSGLVQAVTDGVYDVFMGDVTITAARREVAAFSASIFDNSLRMIIKKPTSVEVDLFSFLRPFSEGLWIAILATMVYASILICLLERRGNEALRTRSLTSVVAMSLWYSIGTIMGYGVDFQVTTASGRLLTVALYILSLVLVATYTANLASILTTSKSKYIVGGIDDIKRGKLSFNRIGIRPGTAAEEFYLREISRGHRNYYPLKSRQELYDSLLNGIIDVSFMDIGVAEYMTNNVYCNLTLVGSHFDDSMLGVVIPKNWLYEQDLDVNILSLRELGELDNLKKHWFQTRNCESPGENPGAMGIGSMAGLFLTIGVISVLALLALFWTQRSTIKKCLSTFRDRTYIVSAEEKHPTTSAVSFRASRPRLSSEFIASVVVPLSSFSSTVRKNKF